MRSKFWKYLKQTIINIYFFYLCFIISYLKSQSITYTVKDIDNNTKEISINFIVPEKDFIYKDFITVSACEPGVSLTPYKTNILPLSYYDAEFADTRYIFNENFSLTMIVTIQNPIKTMHIYCGYYRHTEKRFNYILLSIDFINNEADSTAETSSELYTTIKRRVSFLNSPLDDYFSFCMKYMEHLFIFLKRHSVFIFIFLLFIFLLFSLLFHCASETLHTKKTLYELFIFFYSLVCFLIFFYIVLYFFKTQTLLKFGILAGASFGMGLFYIKRNTDAVSEFVQVVSVIIGISCISIGVVLLFKTTQFCL